MARHRDSSFHVAFIQLSGLLVLGLALSPVLRGWFVWTALLMALGIVVSLVCLKVIRGHHSRRTDIAPSLTRHFATTQAPKPMQPKLHELDWFQFEKLVAEVYRQQGYAVQRRGGARPDGGVDLVVSKDGVTSAVQCKQWKSWKVGVKQIREFLGAMTDGGFQKGIFVTLQPCTNEARELALRRQIELVDERQLLQMIDSSGCNFHQAGSPIIDATRKTCPRCESDMVLKTARRGQRTGQQFWGCSTYPKCTFTFQHVGG